MFLNSALPNRRIIPKISQIKNDIYVIAYSNFVNLILFLETSLSSIVFLFLFKFNIPIELCKRGKKKTIFNRVTGKWIITSEDERMPFVNRLQIFILK